MSTARICFAAVVHSGSIFAIGGVGLNSVEYYVPAVNKWASIAPMNTIRFNHQAGVANNILFVYGGRGQSSRLLDTVERYSPDEDKWTLV